MIMRTELGWTVYFANTIQRNSEDLNNGGGSRGTLVGLLKATVRVDSRPKLTFGQLVSKSTHHV